ncbi:MAG: hypothetical protein KKB51_01650 [Candidatus Riflebacteria bacterium]|nr:hypothetical protein [Candidatus Riflebacteria bacterium]
MSKLFKSLSVLLVALCLFAITGETSEIQAATKKVSCLKKITRTIKRKVKKTIKHTRRAIGKTGANVQNAIADSAVKAKKAITGKKKSTFVKGHYKKGQKSLTNGHFRKVSKGGKR